MTELHLDIETFSDLDLRKVNVYRYVQSPEFEIMTTSWSLDRGPVYDAVGPDAAVEIPGLWDPSVLKIAHNAGFERVCFSEMGHRIGEVDPGEYLPPEEWHDTMAVAGELGYPMKLEHLARALGGEQKDGAGTALINFFCKPRRDGGRNRPEDHPEKWAQFVRYCNQDVVTLKDVDARLGRFPTETERAVWIADQRINDRGMKVDVGLAAAAMEAASRNQEEQAREVIRLTGVANPNSGVQMLGWLRSRKTSAGRALPVPNLQKETVTKLLERDDLDDTARSVLELRQELALAASKKYAAALSTVCRDERLRGSFFFFGAHTGRWAGRGVQPHNLPREQITKQHPITGKKVWDGEMEEALITDLLLGLGGSAHVLKALVRPLFVGPFTIVDYAAIEARVIAWLAGEEWALEAFRDGRDIYVETAGRMSRPGNKMTRSQGKVAVLALGYQGGVGSLRVMGAEGSDEELKFLVTQWREANPAIVELWYTMERSFRLGGPVGEHLYVEKDGTDRLVRLPSGRAVCYRGVQARWEETKFGRRQVLSFLDPKRPGVRESTYGGRLIENATQAVARDVLAEALVRLDRKGFRVVGHVHDEILTEGGDVASVSRIMTQPPEWAPDLPVGAAGFQSNRYRKD